MKYRVKIGSLLLGASIGALIAGGAGVTKAQASQASGGRNGQIEEIVVTANRRAENIQKVPLVVTAISGRAAAVHGVTDFQSLANAVPGLTFNRVGESGIPFLRGVGSSVTQASAEPSVAFYVDDVYNAAEGAAFSNFNSVDRLEVEKGPQGTLFGRNASGGVIQVFTKNPTPTPYIDAQVGYANYNTPSASIYATGQIAKNLSANISLYGSNQGDGWGRNVTTGAAAFKLNRDYGGRVKFLWTPTSDTTVLFSIDHDTTYTSEGAYRPAAGTTGGGVAAFSTPGFYDMLDYTNPYFLTRQGGASLKVTQNLDWAKLVSISSYRRVKQFQSFEESGGPAVEVNAQLTAPATTWTQELQLLSPANSALTWITGFFFMHDKSGYDPLQLIGTPASVVLFPIASSTAMQTTNSYAVFGQATATVLPDTHLTIGLRYTIDTRQLDASISNGAFGPSFTVGNSPQSLESTKFTPKFVLDHQFTDDIMGYVSYSRGFKSAMYNAVVIPLPQFLNPAINPPIRPETLDDYSIGVKTEFFNHRLRINSEAFFYQFKNIQISEILNGGSFLTNAASAEIKGIDLDVTAVPVEHLTLAGGLEVLDGHYTSFPNGLFWKYVGGAGQTVGNCPSGGANPGNSNCVNPNGPVNLQGSKTVNTPPFSFDLTADYLYPTRFGPLDFNLAYNHTGNYYFDPDNGGGQIDPNVDRQPVLNLVNATIGWTSADDRYNVHLWAKNLTGQQYYSVGVEEAILDESGPAPPRTFGVTLGVHFE